jgi:AcrR family transcriptional regulator
VPARSTPDGPSRPRRGRPPKLTRDAILEAAEELGLTTFTVTRLADHLGVSEGTLYRYVRSTGEITAAVCSRQLAAVDVDLPGETTWAGYLQAVCAQLRARALATPGFARWLVGGEYGDGDLAVFDAILDGMTAREPGLDRDTAYLMGSQAVACTAGLVTSGFVGAVPGGEPTDADSDEQFAWMLRSLLRGMADHLAEGVPPPRAQALRPSPET